MVALINWDPSYSVNINSIDTQHKKLINMINNLHEAMLQGRGKEVLGSIFNELASYTIYHFNHEEELFAKYDYMEQNKHKAEHERLIAQVNDLKNNFNKGGSVLTMEVMNFLKLWLSDHIIGSDKKYSSFLNERGVN
ncbi:MAG: bacteriohemerythrin [Bacteroidota bacterium]